MFKDDIPEAEMKLAASWPHAQRIADLEADVRELLKTVVSMGRLLAALVGPAQGMMTEAQGLRVIAGDGRGRSKRRAKLTILQGETDQERTRRLARNPRYW